MKTKKFLSAILAITIVVGVMATFGMTASAKPATDQYIKVGETQVIRTEGIYSNETTDGNYYYVSVVDGSTQSVPMNNISIESVEQDDNEMVITIKGVAVTDEELVDIVAKVYREDESDWVDVAIRCAYHVVLPDDAEYLDLDENTTEILDNKKLDQNYNLTVNEGTKTDVTKVKLSWEIKDINATRTDNMIWDTENLCWKTDSSSTTINQQGKAKFTLENYSSVEIDATAEFEALSDEDVIVSFGDDATITLDTANGNDTYSKTNVPTGEITVTVTPSENFFNDKTASNNVKYGIYTVTIAEHEEEPACIASGTMVTLANGTKKVIDDVTLSDSLLTYNFFTGEIEGNKPLYILKNDNILSSVITLSFSDGSELEICDEQSFFDMDARDYFLISRKNYQNAVGKNIMQLKDGEIKTVTITDISIEKRYCTSYELATENAVNFVTNDIVNTLPDYFLPGTYTFGEDMKIDAEKYQKDIEKYGLYTYADFAKYFTENTFIKGHLADIKIAVGKGLISEEDLFAYYEQWISFIQTANM